MSASERRVPHRSVPEAQWMCAGGVTPAFVPTSSPMKPQKSWAPGCFDISGTLRSANQKNATTEPGRGLPWTDIPRTMRCSSPGGAPCFPGRKWVFTPLGEGSKSARSPQHTTCSVRGKAAAQNVVSVGRASGTEVSRHEAPPPPWPRGWRRYRRAGARTRPP